MSQSLPSLSYSCRYICHQCRTKIRQQPIRTLTTSLTHQQVTTREPTTSTRPKASLSNISGGAHNSTQDLADQPPRWMRTPSAMKQPYSPRQPNSNNDWQVNEDPIKLERTIARMLGTDRGSESVLGNGQILDEEVQWLAVTHKSFDQGRRGFNDRLAFLGKA